MKRFSVAAILLAAAFHVACDDDTVKPGGGGTPPLDSVKVFLDIESKVSAGGERGLLGLAFHPNHAANGYFFVNYTRTAGSAWETVVARYEVKGSNPNEADPASERILLVIPQWAENHNGGAMAFGNDGYLYIATGDGGGSGDPMSNAQDRTNLLGAILRLDVDQNVGSAPYYGIPSSNPYHNNADGYAQEIYAFGLRNPWRISIDPVTGWLWLGDVGQATWEEVNVVKAGGANFGWDCREGAHNYFGPPDGPSVVCPSPNMVDPLFEYDHSSGNRSITGGRVCRSDSLPSLAGKYIYADFASGRIWALNYDGTNQPLPTDNALLRDAPFRISSFGVGEDNNLYILSYDGTDAVRELTETETSPGVYTYSIGEPWSGYDFQLPVDLQNAGDGTNRLFVVEQSGRIMVFSGVRD